MINRAYVGLCQRISVAESHAFAILFLTSETDQDRIRFLHLPSGRMVAILCD